MLERYLRKFYQVIFVVPAVKFLLRFKGITPNKITLLAAITGVVAGFLLAIGWSLTALVFMLLSGYFDTLDGTFARMAQQMSDRGSVFDIVSDRLVEFSIVLGFYLQAPLIDEHGLSCIVMLGSFLLCVSSFLVVGVFSQNTGERSFYYSPGLIERPEAFLFFALMILIPSWFNVLAWILIVLVLLTTLIRVVEFYQQQGVQHAKHTD